MIPPETSPEDLGTDLAAIELAFGLLDPAEAAAAETRALTDTAFAAEVERWRVYLAAWLSSHAEAPPASVWTGVAAAIGANDDAPAAAGRLRFWRSTTAIVGAAALMLGIVAVRRPPATVTIAVPREAPARVQTLAALLKSPEKTRPAMTVTLAPERDRLLTIPASVSVGAGAAELWVIPAGGAPVALGLVAATTPSTVRLAADRARLLVPGATIAVSREPAGGSRTGQPTGPVILAGELVVV